MVLIPSFTPGNVINSFVQGQQDVQRQQQNANTLTAQEQSNAFNAQVNPLKVQAQQQVTNQINPLKITAANLKVKNAQEARAREGLKFGLTRALSLKDPTQQAQAILALEQNAQDSFPGVLNGQPAFNPNEPPQQIIRDGNNILNFLTPKPKGGFRLLTNAEKKSVGIPAGTVAQVNSAGKVNIVRKNTGSQDIAISLKKLGYTDRQINTVLSGVNKVVTDANGNAIVVNQLTGKVITPFNTAVASLGENNSNVPKLSRQQTDTGTARSGNQNISNAQSDLSGFSSFIKKFLNKTASGVSLDPVFQKNQQLKENMGLLRNETILFLSRFSGIGTGSRGRQTEASLKRISKLVPKFGAFFTSDKVTRIKIKSLVSKFRNQENGINDRIRTGRINRTIDASLLGKLTNQSATNKILADSWASLLNNSRARRGKVSIDSFFTGIGNGK